MMTCHSSLDHNQEHLDSYIYYDQRSQQQHVAEASYSVLTLRLHGSHTKKTDPVFVSPTLHPDSSTNLLCTGLFQNDELCIPVKRNDSDIRLDCC